MLICKRKCNFCKMFVQYSLVYAAKSVYEMEKIDHTNTIIPIVCIGTRYVPNLEFCEFVLVVVAVT